MHETLPESEADGSAISEDTLLSKLWTQPKATLTYILGYCPDKYVSVLFMLGGIVRAIDRASSKNQGDHLSTAAILMLAVISGSISGWLSYSLYSWGMRVTGNWLGGRASTDEFKTIMAWSLVPSIAGLLFLIPEVAILGDKLFRTTQETASALEDGILTVCQIGEVVLSVWSFVLLVKGTRIIQGFSVGRALANILLPAIVIIAPILLLVLAFAK
jgi:hypothetical protein